MPEVTIQYKSHKTLEVLIDFAKYFDFTIKTEKKARHSKKKSIPIQFADHPDISALAGIWKDKEITIEQLRSNAWGDRL